MWGGVADGRTVEASTVSTAVCTGLEIITFALCVCVCVCSMFSIVAYTLGTEMGISFIYIYICTHTQSTSMCNIRQPFMRSQTQLNTTHTRYFTKYGFCMQFVLCPRCQPP